MAPLSPLSSADVEEKRTNGRLDHRVCDFAVSWRSKIASTRSGTPKEQRLAGRDARMSLTTAKESPMTAAKSEPAPIPRTADVQYQPLVALLCRIRFPPGFGVDDGDLLLGDAEAAEFLRISLRSLQRLRQRGAGPPVIRIGRRRLVYRLADLQQWARERSSPATRKGIRSASLPERQEIADQPELATEAAEDLVPETCGGCTSFDNGHCYARGFAVGADEPRCPLFEPVAYVRWPRHGS